MSKVIDLTGHKYNLLTVIGRDLKQNLNKNKSSMWKCRCDCGNITTVSSSNLRFNGVKSCGCLPIKNRTKHSLSSSKEYSSWHHMKQRCLNSNSDSYNYYGGRGITICEEWIDSFEQFYKDVGSMPAKGYTLDRINTNGNYEPSNCKWSTRKEQSINRRGLKIKNKVEADKIRKLYASGNYTQQELADKYNCCLGTISDVINKKRWI